MRTIYFKYKSSKNLIVAKINSQICYDVSAFLTNEIKGKIKEDMIFLQKRKILHHPLQRVFVGKIQYIHHETIISGKFKYPLLKSIIFVLFILILINGNIKLMFSTMLLINKLISLLFFMCMYLIIGLLFLTGKIMFKKQENEIIEFLKRIEHI